MQPGSAAQAVKRRAAPGHLAAVGDDMTSNSVAAESAGDDACLAAYLAKAASALPSAPIGAHVASLEHSTAVRPPVGRSFAATLRRWVLCRALPACQHGTVPRAVTLALTLYTVYMVSYMPPVSLDGLDASLRYLHATARVPWSVLVQHEDAVARLNVTHRAPCGSRWEPCDSVRIGAAFLPSWTLRVVQRDCAWCLDTGSYRAAVEGVVLHRHHGVFATSSAPLGRVGPMLLAMASVTDDVDVRAELRRWEWLRHVYGEGFPTVGDGAEAAARPRSPYLAVMGIPSTDQPARVALREAQRKTWVGYQEVARGDNGFTGALLALYVFAAAELAPGAAARKDAAAAAHSGATAADAVRGRLRVPLPTAAEYRAATEALLAMAMQAASIDAVAGERYVQRRMELRRNWRTAAVGDTPCAGVVGGWTAGDAETTALSYLSGALSLPVTPAFTSPAEYICHASSALWQEALAHRNVVWVDMMTDRRPTTNKRLGDTGKWGLAVEVGMSQKLILWLEYAYHAFPTVPFIIKGDDDSYVKVPQFLSDVRYVMSSRQAPGAPLALDSRAGTGAAAAVNVSSTECAYWGSYAEAEGVVFNTGMMFTLHRLLVRVLLEPNSNEREADVVLLGVTDYDPFLWSAYTAMGLQFEDIMIGMLLRAALERAKKTCRNNRVWYVKEGLGRFHDMHRGRLHAVTWSTVVAHRCTPADYYYLHHFFQTELQASVNVSRRMRSKKAVAREVARWVAEQRRTMGPGVVGWDGLPDVQWVRDLERTPGYDMAEADGVPVYRVEYEALLRREMGIEHGLLSQPQD
ncbi:hypothetical protein GH5_03566 [Leishmania sp. Ghana 2012 LV757]|uniref:hypothetical protein n=1 Tax=Leishmania sp. Ghana 2012 LV757 TaxID=2803181 RepID=UPI001B4CE385|nr:hypothetical protein GH5_03566 [Leishmania sp. Ghana 2012 LV757]